MYLFFFFFCTRASDKNDFFCKDVNVKLSVFSFLIKLKRMIDHDFRTCQPITSSAAYILGEIVTSKMEAAQPLVRVMTHHGQIVSIIRALAKWEISKVT